MKKFHIKKKSFLKHERATFAPLHTQPPDLTRVSLSLNPEEIFLPFSYFHSPQHIVTTLSVVNLSLLGLHDTSYFWFPSYLSSHSFKVAFAGWSASVGPFVFLMSGPPCFHYSAIYYPSIITLIPTVALIAIHTPQISISTPNCSPLIQAYLSNSFLNIYTWMSCRHLKTRCPRLNSSSFSTIPLWLLLLLLSQWVNDISQDRETQSTTRIWSLLKFYFFITNILSYKKYIGFNFIKIKTIHKYIK